MKRFAIVLLLLALLFTMIGCADTSEINPVSIPATTNTITAESEACINHDFAEASFISPRKCKICEETEGEPLCLQCETWEEVVALAGFEEYIYDLQVMGTEDHVILYITIDDDSLFATDDAIYDFMLESYAAFFGISWFSQNRLGVTTPEKFQVDVSIDVNFPGGSLICMPIENRYGTGYSTMLNCDKELPNKSKVESAYYFFFNLTAI